MKTSSTLIETPHLNIRYLEPGDVESIYSYKSDPRVTRFHCYDPMSRAQVKEFIADFGAKAFGTEGEWVQYAIVRKIDNELVGDCAAFLVSRADKIAEVGLSINPVWQGKGIGMETLSALINWLFETHGIKRIDGVVELENLASIALLKKLGFKQDATILPHPWKNKDKSLFGVYVLNNTNICG